MAGVEVDVSHAAISRALASLGGCAGATEVAAALDCDWESFEAQMRRRMRCRAREHRGAYRCLACAGSEKVRFHLEATGVIPRCGGPARRSPGVAIRVRGGERRRRKAPVIGRRPASPPRPVSAERAGATRPDQAVRRRGGR